MHDTVKAVVSKIALFDIATGGLAISCQPYKPKNRGCMRPRFRHHRAATLGAAATLPPLQPPTRRQLPNRATSRPAWLRRGADSRAAEPPSPFTPPTPSPFTPPTPRLIGRVPPDVNTQTYVVLDQQWQGSRRKGMTYTLCTSHNHTPRTKLGREDTSGNATSTTTPQNPDRMTSD